MALRRKRQQRRHERHDAKLLEVHEQKLTPFLEFLARRGVLHVDGITLNDASTRLNGWTYECQVSAICHMSVCLH